MSEIFASATVTITPDLTGFTKQLEKDLKAKIKNVVVPPVRVRPALTVDFVGSLRKQVNAAIIQAQKGLKPILIKALIEPIGTTGHIVPGGGVAGGVGGAGGGTEGAAKKVKESTLITNANNLRETSEKRLAAIEDKVIAKQTESARALVRYEETVKALPPAEEALRIALKTTNVELQKSITVLVEKIEAEKKARASALELARAQAQVQKTSPGRASGPSAQARGLTSGLQASNRAAEKLADRGMQAQLRLNEASAVAERQSTRLATARSFLAEVTHAEDVANRALTVALKGSNIATIEALSKTHSLAVAQREQATTALAAAKAQAQIDVENRRAAASAASAARTSARSQAQLSRGAQASLLSIGGVRGATLAASRSFLIGAAGITIFAKAVKSFADLETNLEVFRATTSSTADQMERVRTEAIALGADLTLPSVSAGDAAGAMVELAKAGLSVEDSLAGARGVLELATAAAIDNAAATQLVANALNAFQLAGRDAVTIADTFANAANLAQGSIADVGTAFQQAAAAGRQVGLSFQDTSLFLTVLAKNGLRGSDAGTSLRTALIRLINPSKAAKEAFKGLGIEIRDDAGNLRPDVFIQITEAMKHMTPAARDANIALIGGQDAFRAISILGRQTIQQFIEMRKQLRQEGSAAELAAARTRGLHGAVDALGSVLETVGTEIGASVGPGLAGFTRSLGAGVNAMSQSEQLSKTLSDSLATLSGSFNLAARAAAAFAPPILFAASAVQQLVNTIGISTLFAGFAAFKILPALFKGISAALFPMMVTMRALGPILLTSGLRVAGLKAAILAAGASFNVYAIAAAAAVAGIVFLATRQSELEIATRSLTEASNNYIDTLGRQKTSQDQLLDTRFSVSAEKLGVLTAKAAANSAKEALENSKAAKGSFARTKLQLELAVAIDGVAAAQQRYKDILKDVAVQEEIAAQDKKNVAAARAEEANSLSRVSTELQRRATLVLGGKGNQGPGAAERAQAAGSKLLAIELKKRAEANRKINTEESLDLAKRQEALIKFVETVKRTPTKKEFRIAFQENAASARFLKLVDQLGHVGKAGAEKLVKEFFLGIDSIPTQLANLVTGRLGAFIKALENAGSKAGKGLADATVDSAKAQLQARLGELQQIIKDSAGRAAGLDIQENLDTIASDAADATLGTEQQKLANASRARRAAEAKIAALTGAGKGLGLGTARKVRAQAIADQAAATQAIRGINDQVASDAKAAADKLAQDSVDAVQVFLDTFNARKQKLENKISIAGTTSSLRDDIKTNKILVQFFRKRIELIKDRIRSMHLHGDALKAAKDAIAVFQQGIFDTLAEISRLAKEQAQSRHDLLIERFDLRIEIAESRGDPKAILRAHRAKLQEISKELVRVRKQYGRNSIEWLRVKAAQADEISKIKDLQGQTKEKNNAFAELTFEFLQKQVGFTQNLLGNLIGGSTSGLVGGTASPVSTPSSGGGGGVTGGGGGGVIGSISDFMGGGTPPPSSLGVAGGLATKTAIDKAGGGPTRGGQSRELALLQQIVHLLGGIHRGAGHPEAQWNRAQHTGGKTNYIGGE